MSRASTLTKPQLPTVQPVKPGKDWPSIWTAFGQVQKHQASTMVNLQDYLNQVYQSIVPVNYPPNPLTPAASPYPVGSTDTFLSVASSASAGVTINLPQAAGTGRLLIFAKTDTHAHNVTLTPNGTDTINGASTYALTTQYQAVTVIDAATGLWLVI